MASAVEIAGRDAHTAFSAAAEKINSLRHGLSSAQLFSLIKQPPLAEIIYYESRGRHPPVKGAQKKEGQKIANAHEWLCLMEREVNWAADAIGAMSSGEKMNSLELKHHNGDAQQAAFSYAQKLGQIANALSRMDDGTLLSLPNQERTIISLLLEKGAISAVLNAINGVWWQFLPEGSSISAAKLGKKDTSEIYVVNYPHYEMVGSLSGTMKGNDNAELAITLYGDEVRRHPSHYLEQWFSEAGLRYDLFNEDYSYGYGPAFEQVKRANFCFELGFVMDRGGVIENKVAKVQSDFWLAIKGGKPGLDSPDLKGAFELDRLQRQVYLSVPDSFLATYEMNGALLCDHSEYYSIASLISNG